MAIVNNNKMYVSCLVAGFALVSSISNVFAASYSFDGRNYETQALNKKVLSTSSGANAAASTIGFDADGNLYIADTVFVPQQQTKVRISKVESSGAVTELYYGDVSSSIYPTQFNYINFADPSVTKNWRTSGTYKYRLYTAGFIDYAIRVDGSGNIIKADLGSCLEPQGMDVDGQGNVYVLCAHPGQSNNYIIKVNFPASGFPSVSRVPISKQYTEMKMWYGPVVDSQGNAYIVGGYFDPYYELARQKTVGMEYANTVLKISPDGAMSRFASTGDNPIAVAIDSKGYIFTVNQYDGNVSVISPQGVTQAISLGAASLPHNLAVDKNDNVYVFGDISSTKISVSGTASGSASSQTGSTSVISQSSTSINTNDDDTTVTTACVNIPVRLQYQSKDVGSTNYVTLLQDFLHENNYLTSSATGFFGSGTLKAVKAFQKANNITQTGSLGPITRAKIKEVSCQ